MQIVYTDVAPEIWWEKVWRVVRTPITPFHFLPCNGCVWIVPNTEV